MELRPHPLLAYPPLHPLRCAGVHLPIAVTFFFWRQQLTGTLLTGGGTIKPRHSRCPPLVFYWHWPLITTCACSFIKTDHPSIHPSMPPSFLSPSSFQPQLIFLVDLTPQVGSSFSSPASASPLSLTLPHKIVNETPIPISHHPSLQDPPLRFSTCVRLSSYVDRPTREKKTPDHDRLYNHDCNYCQHTDHISFPLLPP